MFWPLSFAVSPRKGAWARSLFLSFSVFFHPSHAFTVSLFLCHHRPGLVRSIQAATLPQTTFCWTHLPTTTQALDSGLTRPPVSSLSRCFLSLLSCIVSLSHLVRLTHNFHLPLCVRVCVCVCVCVRARARACILSGSGVADNASGRMQDLTPTHTCVQHTPGSTQQAARLSYLRRTHAVDLPRAPNTTGKTG